MAKSLNLKTDWIDEETLRVSWTDVQANDTNHMAGNLIPIVFFVLFLFAVFSAISGGSFIPMFLLMIGLIIVGIWFRSGSTSVPNYMDFSAQSITCKNREYPTNEVTRFEYGPKSQLTGVAPPRDGQGGSMSDPMLIRMWLNDSAVVGVSENNWQTQVNHEIRDTLAKALDAVRNINKQQEHEQEFGKVSNETGMPEY